MTVFKKIVAAIFMILSIIAIVVLIIALIGSWAVKGRLETISVDMLLAGETAIEKTREGLDRVDNLLGESNAVVEEVDTRVQEIGDDLKANETTVTEILQVVGIDLAPSIEQAQARFEQIAANLVAINDAVDAVKAIPLLGLDSRLPDVSRLQEIEDSLAQLISDVEALRQDLKDRRVEIVDGKVTIITDVTTELSDSLTTTQTRMQETDVRLAENAEAMADLRERIPGIYTMITILLNLIFLLTTLAFISLFLHSWQYFKCTENGLRGLMPGDCEQAPAAA